MGKNGLRLIINFERKAIDIARFKIIETFEKKLRLGVSKGREQV
jgi:hypothetical protein